MNPLKSRHSTSFHLLTILYSFPSKIMEKSKKNVLAPIYTTGISVQFFFFGIYSYLKLVNVADFVVLMLILWVFLNRYFSCLFFFFTFLYFVEVLSTRNCYFSLSFRLVSGKKIYLTVYKIIEIKLRKK